MASMRDVAKRAGVGVGTVSRMLNNSGYVSEETAARIKEAMEELDYTPNELARNLFYKKTGVVAVLVPNISNPFFAEFVDNVETELYNAGFKMMLCTTDKEHNAEREYLDMLNRHIVDGAIIGAYSLDVEVYRRIHKPIVALDRYIGEDIPVVAVNHKEGGRLAAETLIKNGCKKVLHFRGKVVAESPYHERHIEFARIMKKNGIETYDYILGPNRLDSQYYKKAVEDVFEKGIQFDGAFGVDRPIIECMNEVIRRQQRVPEDVKFVAYDGTYITELVEPKVTAIVQPIEELARESVRLLVNMLQGKVYKNRKVMLKATLRKGGTTVL